MRNLAWVGPVRPAQSSTVDQGELLLPELAQRVVVDLFLDRYLPETPRLHEVCKTHKIQTLSILGPQQVFDAIVYQVADEPHHTWSLDLLPDAPGVVDLHDLTLCGLFAQPGRRVIRDMSTLLHFAPGVITHTIEQQESIARLCRHKRVQQLPLPAAATGPVPAEEVAQVRAELGVVADAKVALIVGELPLEHQAQVQSAAERAGAVTVFRPATDPTLPELVRAADVCLGLGDVAASQTLAWVLRAMGCAKPVITWDALLAFPADACVQVARGPQETEALAAALQMLLEDPAQSSAMGAAGCDYVRRAHAPAVVARQYLEALAAMRPAPLRAASVGLTPLLWPGDSRPTVLSQAALEPTPAPAAAVVPPPPEAPATEASTEEAPAAEGPTDEAPATEASTGEATPPEAAAEADFLVAEVSHVLQAVVNESVSVQLAAQDPRVRQAIVQGLAAGGTLHLAGTIQRLDTERPPEPWVRRQLPMPDGSAPAFEWQLDLPAPAEPGPYLVHLCLEAELAGQGLRRLGADWRYELTVVYSSRSPSQLAAAILPRQRSVQSACGATVVTQWSVHNQGDTRWNHQADPAGGFVQLGAHLLTPEGKSLIWDFARTPLPKDVYPRELVEIPLVITAPTHPGVYRVELDLVNELQSWFREHGNPGAYLDLTVH